MWKRVRARLTSVGVWVGLVAWLLGSVMITTDLLGVEAHRSNLWVLGLIFFSPFAVAVVAEEAVRRVRHGPQAPGRHSRQR